MSDVEVNIGVKGRYRLLVKRNGDTINDTGWFDNLITNQGMDFLGTSTAYLNSCQVGSSSTTPAYTDVALGARVAGVSSAFSQQRIETTSRYCVDKKTFTFSSGTATGNISEVGVGTGETGNTLFSRALILDSFGNPTTITVTAEDDLIVIYELWFKQPTSDFTASVSGYDFTIRASMVDAIASIGWISTSNLGSSFILSLEPGTCYVYTGAFGAITGRPSGTSVAMATSSGTNEPYTPGSHYRIIRLRWLPAQANDTDYNSISYKIGVAYFQASVSPPLRKNSNQSLSIRVRTTWSRDSGPA